MKMTLGKDYIKTNDIVAKYDRNYLLKSGLFEMTGADGSEGLSMRKNMKDELMANGFVPVRSDGTIGKCAKMWHVGVLPIADRIIREAVEKSDANDADEAKSAIDINIDAVVSRVVRRELEAFNGKAENMIDSKLSAFKREIVAEVVAEVVAGTKAIFNA